MKTVWPHTNVNGIGRSILVAFSDNYRYSSFSFTKTPKAGFYRLVTMWPLKLSSELFPLLHQNPLVSHALWMDLLPLHGFVTYIKHLETFCSLSSADVPNVVYFIMWKNQNQKNSTFVNIYSDLIRKVLEVMENFQVHSGPYKFSKILFFPWKCKYCYWQQILSVVCLEVTGFFHSPSSAPDLPCLSVSCSVVQLATWTVPKCFP